MPTSSTRIAVFWGDTHLHTTNSLDARLIGVTLGVEDAYRFARGERVVASSGQPARLSRPLDFLVVTDHSDLLGIMDQLLLGNPALLEITEVSELHEQIMAGREQAAQAFAVIGAALDGDYDGPLHNAELMRSAWERYVETADRFNEPGKFTALIGYEWTPTKSGDKLHRNVVYRDGAEKARRMFPFTARDSINPQHLWAWMARYEQETGGSVLALAHNGKPVQRPDVPGGDESEHRRGHRCGLCRNPEPLGAALRSHADQGRQRGDIRIYRRLTNSPTLRLGTGATPRWST